MANRSGLEVQTLSRGCGNRRGSEASPLAGSRGGSPWRAFGDFPRVGKVTRVQGGAPAGGCRDCRPRKNPWVQGGTPALGECRGDVSPLASQRSSPGSEGVEIKQPAQREKRKIPLRAGKEKTCRKCRQQAKKFHLSVDKKSWKYYNNFCYGLIRRDKSVPERPASGGAGGVNLCCGRAEAKLPQRMGSYHYWERKLPCSLI